MFNIAISNHPFIDTIERKAQMTNLRFDEREKIVVMDIKIFHFISDVSVGDLDREISLTLDNEKQYPDGQGGFIGDYDYFTYQAEMGISLKQLVEAGVLSVDADGTINSKCNYKS